MPPEKHAAEAETQTDVHQPEESGNRAWAGRDQEVQTTGLLEGDVSTLEGTSVPAAVETSDKEIQTDVQDIASSVPADTAPAAPELPLQQERASNPAERTALQASDAGPTEPMEEEAKVTEILVKIAQSPSHHAHHHRSLHFRHSLQPSPTYQRNCSCSAETPQRQRSREAQRG